VLFGDIVFAHPLVHVAKTIPSIVVSVISTNCAPVRQHGFVEFFVGYVLVALQSESVGKLGVELRRSCEALDSIIVLSLK
jgi:hypothetical protein